jgi:hypothetical protein
LRRKRIRRLARPPPPESRDGLAVCLAQHGVPPDVVQTALAALAYVKAVRLCKPSEERAWEIQAHAS